MINIRCTAAIKIASVFTKARKNRKDEEVQAGREKRFSIIAPVGKAWTQPAPSINTAMVGKQRNEEKTQKRSDRLRRPIRSRAVDVSPSAPERKMKECEDVGMVEDDVSVSTRIDDGFSMKEADIVPVKRVAHRTISGSRSSLTSASTSASTLERDDVSNDSAFESPGLIRRPKKPEIEVVTSAKPPIGHNIEHLFQARRSRLESPVSLPLTPNVAGRTSKPRPSRSFDRDEFRFEIESPKVDEWFLTSRPGAPEPR